jgi:hypothetical protein
MLVASKTFMSQHLLNRDGEGLVELIKRNKLWQMMDMFTTLCSPNVKNLVASFKHLLNNKG